MVKYLNEFGEVRRTKKPALISEPVLKDLEALKIYTDEPIDSVIKRLLQNMNPEEMTQAIFAKLREINAKMSGNWNSRLKENYGEVHRKRLGDKEWVQKLYEEALMEEERT